MKRAKDKRALNALLHQDIRQERKQTTCNCPYCGSKMVIRPSSFINTKYEKNEYMVCLNYPDCDSYARVEKYNGKYELVSTPANRELRLLRKEAHFWIDKLIETGIATNYTAAFAMTSQRLSTSNGTRIHIGQCRELTCREIITACVDILMKNKERIGKIDVWNGSRVNNKEVLNQIRQLKAA